MSRPYRLADVSQGYANVMHPKTGARLGSVQRRRKTYNLRRLIVSTWWQATQEAGDERARSRHNTRDEAARWIVEQSCCCYQGCGGADEPWHQHADEPCPAHPDRPVLPRTNP